MIDVPARVKDALKSGDYRKNYRVLVSVNYPYALKETVTFSISGTTAEALSTNFDGFNVGDGCRYKYGEPNAFSSLEITVFVNGRLVTYPYYAVSSESETYVNFTFIEAFTGQIVSIQLRGVNVSEPDAFDVELYQNMKTLVIDNNNLVSESVKFDERMCSDSELKFGLCEGTSVEFQYFDKPNIRDHQIEIQIDVEYKDENNALKWYSIPMGHFEVNECSRQASTGIIKASAYNKLQSTYLDADCTVRVQEILDEAAGHSESLANILDTLLSDYAFITSEYEECETRIYGETNTERTTTANFIYNSNGTRYHPPQEFESGVPLGDCFGLFEATFYMATVDDWNSTTSHYYHCEIDFPKLWEAISYIYGTLTQFNYDTQEPETYANTQYYIDDGNGSYVLPINSKYAPGYVTLYGIGNLNIGEQKAQTYTSADFTNTFPKFTIRILVTSDMDQYTQNISHLLQTTLLNRFKEVMRILTDLKFVKMYRKIQTPIEEKQITPADLSTNSAVTLRDLQSAVFEIDCQYGKLDRVTDLFAGIDLNNGALFPRDDLYPDDMLLPEGISEAGYPAMYSKLWADEGNVRSFRNLIITYKTTSGGSEVEAQLTKVVNANGTDDYIMDDNWLFRNLIWTAQQVGTYADAMVSKMQNIRWFPFEMWCVGLPYLEAGDAIEIKMKEGTYLSYVLRRTLNGIQNLQDEMINGTLDIF